MMVSELPVYLFHLLKHKKLVKTALEFVACLKSLLFTDGIVYLMFILKGKI